MRFVERAGGAGGYYWQVDLGPDPNSGKNKMAHGYVETLSEAQTMIELYQRAGTHQLRHRGPRSPWGSESGDSNTCGPA